MKLCFTGYRPHKLPWGAREQDVRCLDLKRRIQELVKETARQDASAVFWTGGARGADTFAAEAVLFVKRDFPGIALKIAVPFPGQAEKWGEADRARYLDILSRADFVTELFPRYTPECLSARNRYMVDESDAVAAVFDGRPGGTANTVRYARKQGKTLILISLGGEKRV